MTPILCSPIPHCPRQPVQAGEAEKSGYVTWSAQVAKAQNVPFIDLNRIILSHYVGLTPEQIKQRYFTPADNTHTSKEGAELNAAAVVEGVKKLSDCPLKNNLVPDRRSTP
jgi:lysophospholipase L1-like esterase